jgi:hypothetical protein
VGIFIARSDDAVMGLGSPTHEDCARRTSGLTISSAEMAWSAPLETIRGKSESEDR